VNSGKTKNPVMFALTGSNFLKQNFCLLLFTSYNSANEYMTFFLFFLRLGNLLFFLPSMTIFAITSKSLDLRFIFSDMALGNKVCSRKK